MVFDFLRKKKKKAPKQDPLAAFDGVIESLDRQGGEVRRSAATLLALRKELKRDLDKYSARIRELEGRLIEASGDPLAEKTLTRDASQANAMLKETKAALAKADGDAKLLLEAAEDLGKKVESLKEERQSARARLSADVSVSDALRTQMAEFDRVLTLDAARDEIEKAHALAELYREDVKPR